MKTSLIALALISLCAACQGETAPAPAAGAPQAAMVPDHAKATEIFAGRCASCHGAQGKGDGPVSAGFNPRPRNLADAAWQAEVSDDHLEKIVQYGGAAVGKSPMMPPNPDLKPEVVAGLREHIRSLKGQ